MNAPGMHLQQPPFRLYEQAQLEAIQLSKITFDKLEAASGDIVKFEELCNQLAGRGCQFKPRVAQLGEITIYSINMMPHGTAAVQEMMLALEALGCDIDRHEQSRMDHFTEDHYNVSGPDTPAFGLYITRCHGGLPS